MPQLFGMHQRHSRLFIVLCFIPVTVFTFIHFIKGNYALSASLLIAVIIFSASFVKSRRNHISHKDKIMIILAMWVCLATASYTIGMHGIFYAFPSVVGLFFLTSVRVALMISIPSAFIFVALIIAHGEPLISIKLFTPLFLTIVFTAFSAYFSKVQQDTIDSELNKDELTKMNSRHAYNDWLTACQDTPEIQSIISFHLDINNFRIVNDTFGFDVGDKLLKQIANDLLELVESDPIVALSKTKSLCRFSGDVFALSLANLPKRADLPKLVLSLRESISKSAKLTEQTIPISASIGIVWSQRNKGEFINVIDNAEAALRQAKKKGKNSLQIYNESVEEHLDGQKKIVKALSAAIENQDFHLVFMPIFNSNGKSVAGAEILIRCNNPILKRFGPERFIPVAEEHGLIEQIDYWVINQTFKLIEETLILNISDIEFYAINISSYQLHNKRFINYIKKILAIYKVSPSFIKFEITETSLIETDLQAIETIVELKRLGFKLSLDDYGTGFTSFNQLKKYPLDSLKIDRSFVSGDTENKEPVKGMSQVIISIAKLYNFDVIAEGIETPEQFFDLKASGCQYFQGYWFSKPLSLKAFVHLLSQQET